MTAVIVISVEYMASVISVEYMASVISVEYMASVISVEYMISEQSEYGSVVLVHEEIIGVLAEVILDAEFLSLPELGYEEVAADEEDADDEVGVDVPLVEKLVEDEAQHVHQLGDEAQHSQREVPDRGREQLDAVDRQKCVAVRHRDTDRHLEQEDAHFSHSGVGLLRLHEVKAQVHCCGHHDQPSQHEQTFQVYVGRH